MASRILEHADTLPGSTAGITPPTVASPPTFTHATLVIDDASSCSSVGVRPGADCSDAQLLAVDWRGADLRDIDFTGADLSGANLVAANLTGANLNGADLCLAEMHPGVRNQC